MAYKDFTVEEATSSDLNTYLMRQMFIVCTSGTRPSSPQLGMRIWETDTHRELVWDGSNWQIYLNKILWVGKVNNESVTSSTSVQDDDELFLAMETNSTYILNLQAVFGVVPGGPNAKISFSVPAGASITWTGHAPHTNQTDADRVLISVNCFTGTGAADVGTNFQLLIDPYGLVRTGATAGNLTFRWAQATSSATATSIFGAFLGTPTLYTAWMRLEKVS